MYFTTNKHPGNTSGFDAAYISGCEKVFSVFLSGKEKQNSRTRVAGLGSITLRTLLVLQASHGEAGLRVNLLACIAVVGQRPHICKKSDVEEGKEGMLFLQLSRVQRS